ncbi:hypothetical protein [Serratia sp. PL7]|uniref:hypothetical protein n=1 Tax=Serratia sp. PL7 TaxID=2952201 RepID=UPI0021AE188B|nr:hypothetical protein [Serratia sp. PL7]
MEKPHAIIEKLQVSADTTSLTALGAEVVALKTAVGLIFQKLQDPLRDSLLKELRQLDNKSLNDLADQLEQFRV